MKRIIPILIITCFFSPIYSQNSLETLEEAYNYFDSERYGKAIKKFDKYFKLSEGSKTDYYFMAASLAMKGKTDEALKFSKKACTGIETLGMMLADSRFQTIHEPLNNRYNQLKEFYSFYNNTRYLERNTALKKIDSLYQVIDFKLVVGFDLYDISEKFIYAKDTAKALYYYKEAILNGNINPMYSGRMLRNIDSYKRKFPQYYDEYFPFVEDLEKWTSAYRKYLYAGKHDSVAFALVNLFANAPSVFISQELLYNAACGFSISGDYEKAGNYLIKAIDAGFKDMKHLFQDSDLEPLFNSPQGQITLGYIIAKLYKPSFVEAEGMFESSMREYSKSKRLVYNYIEAKGFFSQIPRAFEIFRNDTGEINMPLFWEDEDIQKTDFEYYFTNDSSNKIDVMSPKEGGQRLILFKTTKNSSYVDYAGSCYNFPIENKKFIEDVRNGKMELSKIPEIRKKHLELYRKSAFKARLITGIDSDDETFIFAIKNGVEYISPSMVSLLKETPPEDLKNLIKYIDYALNHTAFFDILVQLAQDSTYFNTLPERHRSHIPNILSKIYHILPFRSLVGDEKGLLPEYNHQWESEENYISKLTAHITEWWTWYKSENPFTLPKMILNESPNYSKIDETGRYFFIEEKTKTPVFYDPIYKKIFKTDSTYVFSSDNFLKGGVIDDKAYVFTPSHHTNPHELLFLSNTSDKDLKKLKLIADNLNLKPSERVKTDRGGFNIKYDRFYVNNAFNDLVYIWHNNDSILINSLSKSKDLSIEKNVLISESQKTCFRDTTKYIETPYCLNSLKAKQLNEYMYVLYNSSISKEPYCSNGYYQNTYLFKIDKELQIIAKIDLPQIFIDGYDPTSNPDVELISTSNKLYAFVWPSCCGPQKSYYQVFDFDLNPISKTIEISKTTGQQAMSMPKLATVVINDIVYIVYPTIENEEEFIKLSILSTSKENNRDFYLMESRGVILENVLIENKSDELKYFYSKKFNDNYYINDVTIKLEILDYEE